MWEGKSLPASKPKLEDSPTDEVRERQVQKENG